MIQLLVNAVVKTCYETFSGYYYLVIVWFPYRLVRFELLVQWYHASLIAGYHNTLVHSSLKSLYCPMKTWLVWKGLVLEGYPSYLIVAP